jgi:MjaI restriction endonuclease
LAEDREGDAVMRKTNQKLPTYVGSVVNLANSFSQATRPRNVGQMSDLIQEYRKTTKNPSVDGWKKFYYSKIGKQAIDDAADKTWELFLKIKKNMKTVTKEDIHGWIHSLIVDKTFEGLQIQLNVLQAAAQSNYRLATPEEESEGIDGWIDGEPVSIKPHTYKKTVELGKEKITHRIVFYKKTKKGIVTA